MNIEQIEQILAGAPKHATHYIDGAYWRINEVQSDRWDGKHWNSWEDQLQYADSVSNLSDLRTILTQAREIERIKAVCGEQIQHLVKTARVLQEHCSNRDLEIERLRSFITRYRYQIKGGEAMQRYIDEQVLIAPKGESE